MYVRNPPVWVGPERLFWISEHLGRVVRGEDLLLMVVVVQSESPNQGIYLFVSWKLSPDNYGNRQRLIGQLNLHCPPPHHPFWIVILTLDFNVHYSHRETSSWIVSSFSSPMIQMAMYPLQPRHQLPPHCWGLGGLRIWLSFLPTCNTIYDEKLLQIRALIPQQRWTFMCHRTHVIPYSGSYLATCMG